MNEIKDQYTAALRTFRKLHNIPHEFSDEYVVMALLQDAERAATKMYIPEIGDRICLSVDWTFRLYCEHRNEGLIERLKITQDGDRWDHWSPEKLDEVIARERAVGWDIEEKLVQDYWRDGTRRAYVRYKDVTLPAGTVLSVDRIYIRKGQGEYSSLSFNVVQSSMKELELKKGPRRRFWAKLSDVNRIEFSRAD